MLEAHWGRSRHKNRKYQDKSQNKNTRDRNCGISCFLKIRFNNNRGNHER